MTGPTRYTDARPGRRKAILFCPNCRYESSIAGDWTEVITETTRSFLCPSCGAVVDRRARRISLEPVERA